MPKTRRVQSRRRRRPRHAGATRRLKGGMIRGLKKLFGKKIKPATQAAPAAQAAPATQAAPAAGGGGGGAANAVNNGYKTRNGRNFINLTANNVARLAPNNRTRYNAFELEMAGLAAELDDAAAGGGGVGSAEANHTPVKNATANGRRFNSLLPNNIAALAPENRSEYNKWKKFEDDFAAMEAEVAAEMEDEEEQNTTANGRPFDKLSEKNINKLSNENAIKYYSWHARQISNAISNRYGRSSEKAEINAAYKKL